MNVAARLEKAAGPGEILVGPLTAELVSDRFVLKAREPTMLKGKRQPVAAFEVVGPRTLAHADGRSEPPLVGRDAELDFLRTCWQRSRRNALAKSSVRPGTS